MRDPLILTPESPLPEIQTRTMTTNAPAATVKSMPEFLQSETTKRSIVSQLRSPAANRPADSIDVTTLSPTQRPAFDAYVRTHADATLFHTLAWCDAVAGSFPHEPCHMVALCKGNIVGALPLFVVRSRLAGRLLVSVPYGVAGGLLADDHAAAAALLTAAQNLAVEFGCRTIELRSRSAGLSDAPIDDRHVTFERELPDRSETVLDWLPRKARAAARNGRDKFGLTAEFGDHLLPDVWQLYTRSMRRLASLAYPQPFFGRLLENTRHRHWVCVVRKEGRAVAGLVTFLFRDRVLPYFVGLSDDARNFSAANYLYYVTMQRAVEAGFRIFDFGRTRRDNHGSFDFKRFHGFEPTPLAYQRISLDGRPVPKLCPTDRRFALARRIWPLLPLRLTTALGGALSRDIPG